MFKYLKLIGLFRSVQTAYKEDTGKDRPFYLSRRFIGAVITTGAGIIAIASGVTLDDDFITTLTDNVEGLIATIMAIYGAVMFIIGLVTKNK